MRKTLLYFNRKPNVNSEDKELLSHGSPDFRFGVYDTDVHPRVSLSVYYHWHDDYEFLTMLCGSMRVIVGNREFVVREGDIVAIPPGIPHTGYRIDDHEITYMATLFHGTFIASYEDDLIQREYVDPLFPPSSVVAPVIIPVGHMAHPAITESLMKIRYQYQQEKPGYELLIKAELLRILYEMYLCRKAADDNANMRRDTLWLKTLLQFIHDNYDQRITLDDMAKHANMSKSYLCRSMKLYFHSSPMEFLAKFRLSQAVRLMETTEMRLVDIALETGFSNVNSFTDAYKKHLNCTPSEYRKKIRKGDVYDKNNMF